MIWPAYPVRVYNSWLNEWAWSLNNLDIFDMEVYDYLHCDDDFSIDNPALDTTSSPIVGTIDDNGVNNNQSDETQQ